MNIIAVENDGIVVETVNPEYKFRKNDILFISGSKEGLPKLSGWLGSDKSKARWLLQNDKV